MRIIQKGTIVWLHCLTLLSVRQIDRVRVLGATVNVINYSFTLCRCFLCSLYVATVHEMSVEWLRDYNPWLLDNYRPVDIAGDGNCLFCAVSVANVVIHTFICLQQSRS